MRLIIVSIALTLTALSLASPDIQAEGASLDTQKARLLERIIATEDDSLRKRLLSIYESLPNSEKSSDSSKTPGKVELYCIAQSKEQKTKVITPSNPFEEGMAIATGERAKIVTTSSTYAVYLTPSITKEGCKGKIDGNRYEFIDCDISETRYWFKRKFRLGSKTYTVDRRTGEFNSSHARGTCKLLENDVRM